MEFHSKDVPKQIGSVDCGVFMLMESRIMRDLCSAVCWIRKNHSLFRGEVTEPAVLQMEAGDQREALREVLEGQSDNRNDPFMFIFNNKEDMETLLSNCVVRMGLKIHAMFT
ncbi:structural maintenance of chromosomes protein 5-like [Paramormyrops kingsleyae]|uniref:structural maintenance of chromosomes protein 5-like n=1 Tax=Paramormyrops kingsleyae TaxID=1676925 RepID=UPI003B96B91D